MTRERTPTFRRLEEEPLARLSLFGVGGSGFVESGVSVSHGGCQERASSYGILGFLHKVNRAKTCTWSEQATLSLQ